MLSLLRRGWVWLATQAGTLVTLPAATARHHDRIVALEAQMTAHTDGLRPAAALTALLRAEVASLLEQLPPGIGDGTEAAVARRVDAARIAALVDALVAVLPVEVPVVEVPDPGQPANAGGVTSDEMLAGRVDDEF